MEMHVGLLQYQEHTLNCEREVLLRLQKAQNTLLPMHVWETCLQDEEIEPATAIEEHNQQQEMWNTPIHTHVYLVQMDQGHPPKESQPQ